MSAPPSPGWMKHLLFSKQYSDCSIKCQGEIFHVHKAVVCTQSPVIAAAMDGQFREAKTETMNLYSFDIDTVKRMIDFLYTGQFNGDIDETAGYTAKRKKGKANLTYDLLRIRLQLHSIADYLEIPALRERAIESICDTLNTDWSPDRFVNALKIMIATTKDAKLYEAMASVAATNITELLELEGFTQLDMPNQMTMGIARELSKEQKGARRTPCRCCTKCKNRR
ncbi:hypothetical protein AJ79_05620 [Helicocarpus griseus UAMH5409]|uniref:BTB domain-containing protein n=1 Tax=Helicocarpus griseus UAMH5409 TaxID=1447875 RepID=A0A2B7XDC8_9EURO|nr:hypothetical protein AJ79_05620 [Helicocarpus griseus UAMH5409]